MGILDQLKSLWNQGYGSSVSHTPSMSQSTAAASSSGQAPGQGARNFFTNLPATLYSRLPEIPRQPVASASSAQPQEEDGYDPYALAAEYIRSRLGNSGASYTGGGPNMQSMMNQIEESYARQQQALDQARSAGQQGIQGAYNTFSGNIGRNYADYTGATQQAQAAMAQRVAEQIAQSQARQAELQRSAQSMGQNYGALTQQQAGNVEAMRAAAGFQQDLGQRMAQVVANNQRALEGSGELVRQGAMGNLETNYQALIGALANAREQQIMQAIASASSGSGGGAGKEQTIKDLYDELNYTQKIADFFAPEDQGMFGGVSTDKLFEQYVNALFQTDDENQQKLAGMIAPYLSRRNK